MVLPPSASAAKRRRSLYPTSFALHSGTRPISHSTPVIFCCWCRPAKSAGHVTCKRPRVDVAFGVVCAHPAAGGILFWLANCLFHAPLLSTRSTISINFTRQMSSPTHPTFKTPNRKGPAAWPGPCSCSNSTAPQTAAAIYVRERQHTGGAFGNWRIMHVRKCHARCKSLYYCRFVSTGHCQRRVGCVFVFTACIGTCPAINRSPSITKHRCFTAGYSRIIQYVIFWQCFLGSPYEQLGYGQRPEVRLPVFRPERF